MDHNVYVRAESKVFGIKAFDIGKQGENQCTTVTFDISKWFDECGEGLVNLYVKRPQDNASYPVALTTNEKTVIWTVSNTDTAQAGSGWVELQYVVDAMIIRSETWMVKVHPSISAPEMDPPDPYESWVEKITDAGVKAIESANQAEASANSAFNDAERAEQSANQATEESEKAKTYAEMAYDYGEKAAESENTARWYANYAAMAAREAESSAATAEEEAGRAETSAQKAEDEADRAEEEAGRAETSAQKAEDEADRAEAAVVHGPYIGENGDWYVWDIATNAYVDTGIRATGRYPYLSLARRSRYLYDITFDKIPEQNNLIDAVPGGCSSYVLDGELYRNLDWDYSNTASFHIWLPGIEGMAFISGLTDTNLDEALLEQLPYRITDGRNDHGIMVSTHVLYNDFNYSVDGNTPLTNLPYLVLSRVKSMATLLDDLNGVLDDLTLTPALIAADYLIQVLVTDGATTYCLAPRTDGTGYEAIDISSNPKLTNFRWVEGTTVERVDLQTRPTGVERWNMIPCDLSDLRFTRAYELPDRLSEFIGIDETTKDSTDEELTSIYNRAHAAYLDRVRDGTTWQTMHSVVYSSRGMEHLWIQEDWEKDYISGSSTWGDIGGNIEEQEDLIALLDEKADREDIPTRVSELENDAGYLTEHQSLDAYRTATEQDEIDSALDERIDDIEAIIPNQATEQNQLADKDFVNSTIQNVAAFYITKNAEGDPFATKAELTAATVYYSGGSVRVPTRNDYCVVLADESKTIAETGENPTTRYIYDNNTWSYQYIVNRSGLTAAQWTAVNSGITAALVGQISANTTARHSHANKTVIDAITSALTAAWTTAANWVDDKKEAIASHLSDGVKHVTASERTAWNGKYSKPAGGIPKNDLSSGVQTSLDKADLALQASALTLYRTATDQDVIDATKYSSDNPPPYPVTTVNGQTGDVTVVTPKLWRSPNL